MSIALACARSAAQTKRCNCWCSRSANSIQFLLQRNQFVLPNGKCAFVCSQHKAKIFRTIFSQLNENKTHVCVCVCVRGDLAVLKVRSNGIIECALKNATHTLTVNNISRIPLNWFDCNSHQKHIESLPVCVCVSRNRLTFDTLNVCVRLRSCDGADLLSF